jgi:hypothetical protein
MTCLAVEAEESSEITWTDLRSDEYPADAFTKLSQQQLSELGYIARVRRLVALDKLKAGGPDARKVVGIEQRLKHDGIDIDYLLSLRSQVRRMRERRGSAATSSMNGSLVRLRGFVVPLQMQGDRVTEFFLVPDFDACKHAPLPTPNQTVFVRTRNGIPELDLASAVLVTGRIDAKRTTRTIRGDDGPVTAIAAYMITPNALEVVPVSRQPTRLSDMPPQSPTEAEVTKGD